MKLQSRLEQEEDAKAALLARIQRLTKLILVSTKSTQTTRFSQRPGPRRRHSFGEEEVQLHIYIYIYNICIWHLFVLNFFVNLDCFQLAYLPYKRRDMIVENESSEFTVPIEGCETGEDSSKEEKRNRKPSLLNWFKLRVILKYNSVE